MKKICSLLLMFVLTASAAFAQFEKGTKYVGASATGLGFTYSSNEKFRFGLEATAGYFVADCLMLRANIGYEHKQHVDDFNVGAGVRYYFDQCGVFIGAGAEFDHFTKSNNDVMIPLTVGYAFFVNQHITIEPSLSYKMSTHDFGGNSSFGLNIGFGFYF
jgi:opacity protein-like surface antigen